MTPSEMYWIRRGHNDRLQGVKPHKAWSGTYTPNYSRRTGARYAGGLKNGESAYLDTVYDRAYTRQLLASYNLFGKVVDLSGLLSPAVDYVLTRK